MNGAAEYEKGHFTRLWVSLDAGRLEFLNPN